jgi:hypothetical protein
VLQLRNGQYTYEELKAALDASDLPPAESWERMIRNGIINREGKVTRLIGGEAEPEPGAMRPEERRAQERRAQEANGK